MASVCCVVLSEKAFNWEKKVETRHTVRRIHLCAVFLFFPSVKSSCHFTPFFTIFTMIMWPLFASNFPWIRKTINPIKTKRGGEGKKRDLSGNLSRSCWALREKRRRSNLEGQRIFPSQVIHLCLQNSFQRPELLCLCCALKSLAGLYEEKQWEHFRKSYKGNGRAEEERKSEWHHW